MNLSPVAVRILGALIEKATTTPEYYPLSLNALVNACNQKNNREPVMQLDEEQVRSGLSELEEHGLAGQARGAEGRVSKFEHRLTEALNLGRREEALLCTLLLRGPQTPGELRGRSERLFDFADLDEVVAALQKLAQREPPLVRILPRQPGTKEARYVHLLSDLDENAFTAADAPSTTSAMTSRDDSRVQRLEEELSNLRAEFDELRTQFQALKSQLE